MTLINPANFPIRSNQLILGLLTSAATDLRTWGENTYTSASAANTAWLGLPASYVGAESERAYALMDQPVTKATEVMFHTYRAAKILDQTETELQGWKGRLVAIEILAALFRNSVIDGVEATLGAGSIGDDMLLPRLLGLTETIPWQEHGPSVQRNARLLADYQAWEKGYRAFLAEQATALAQVAATASTATPVVYSSSPTLTNLDPGGNQPWGVPVAERRTLPEAVEDLLRQTVSDIGTIGLATSGVDPHDRRTWLPSTANPYDPQFWQFLDHRIEYGYQFWGGTVDSLGSLLLLGPGLVGQWQRDKGNTNSFVGWLAQRGDRGTASLLSIMALDPNSANPAHQWSQNQIGTGSMVLAGFFSLPRGGPLPALARLGRLTPNGAPPGAFRLLSWNQPSTNPFGNLPATSTVRSIPPRLNINVADVNKLINGLDAPSSPKPANSLSNWSQRTEPTAPPGSLVSDLQTPAAPITRTSDAAVPTAEVVQSDVPATPKAPTEPVATPNPPSHPEAPTPPRPVRNTVNQEDATQPLPNDAGIAEVFERAKVDGVAVDHRSGQPLRADGPNGERNWHLKWDPDANEWVAENPGAAGLTESPKNLAPTGTPGTYGYDANGDLRQYANYRPPHRPEDVATVWTDSRNAQVQAIGKGDLDLPEPGEDQMWVRVRDDAEFEGESLVTLTDDVGRSSRYRLIEWRPGESRDGLWDMGHTPDAKYSDLHGKYMRGEIELDEFLDGYQSAGNYRVEDPGRNRAHDDE